MSHSAKRTPAGERTKKLARMQGKRPRYDRTHQQAALALSVMASLAQPIQPFGWRKLPAHLTQEIVDNETT